jgi:Tol biopolymer transport system component
VGVFDGVDAPGNIKIYDLARDKWTTLTSHPAEDSRPLWTADGLKVAFRSNRDGGAEMFWQSVDGNGQAERLMHGPNADRTPWAVSPNGNEMVFSEFDGQNYDLRVLRLDRSGGTRTLPRTRFFKGSPAISPNGRWIEYRAGESGLDEIYVRPWPEWDEEKIQISESGGRAPAWSADGRELFFLDLSGGMMVTRVQTSDHFTYAKPKLLFESTHVKGAGGTRNYDVAPDGRFLMIKEVERRTEPPARDKVTVIVNWSDEFRHALDAAK